MAGDRLQWKGAASGAWGTASNWSDITQQSVTASAPPDATNPVTILTGSSAITINGPGVAGDLTLDGTGQAGTIRLAGQFSAASLTAIGSVLLAVNAGDALNVSGDAAFDNEGILRDRADYGGSVSGSAARFTVGGQLTVGVGVLAISSGGLVTAGALTVTGSNGPPGSGAVTVDASSTLEVGAAGGAQAGWLTVDAGATATLAQAAQLTATNVLNKGAIVIGSWTATLTATGALDNEGTITVQGGAGTPTQSLKAGSLVDNGAVVVAGGSLNLAEAVSGAGSISLNGGILETQQVASSISLQFGAQASVLMLSAASLGANATYGAAIAGFSSIDTIDYSGLVTAVSYASGVLTLFDGPTAVARLNLSGDYSGKTFLVETIGGGSTQISVSSGGDTATAPAGSASGHDYQWSGPTTGSWDNAANWSGGAPGALDTVNINNVGGAQWGVITGAGNAAKLSMLFSDVILAGQFTAGAVVLDDSSLRITAGHSLTVTGDAGLPAAPDTSFGPGVGGVGVTVGGSGPVDSVTVDGAGARLTIGGTLTVTAGFIATAPVLSALDGAIVQVGALSASSPASNGIAVGGGPPPPLTGVVVDGQSSIEVGAKGGAAPGSFTVDAGAVAAINSELTAPEIINDGTIVAIAAAFASGALVNDGVLDLTAGALARSPATLDVTAPISGTGQIVLETGQLILAGSVAAGQTIHFDGQSWLQLSSAALGAGGDFSAVIDGFATGDGIELAATITSVTFANGVLTLLDGSATVGALRLVGDYNGATFSVSQPQSGESEIQVTTFAPPTPMHELEGTGASDFLLQNSNGALVLAGVTGGHAAYEQIGGLGPEWTLAGDGDFMADGHDSFLIHDTAGDVAVGEIGTDGQAHYSLIGALGPEWSFKATGDFLNNGQDGFLIENSSGALVFGSVSTSWPSAGQASYVQIGALGPEWTFEGVGHFLADGKTGFLIENTAGAVVVGEIGSNGQAAYTQVAALGSQWKFVGTGDFLGDGHTDFLIQNAAGEVVVGEVGSNGQAAYTAIVGLGSDWTFKGTGDFLGVGHDEFLIENSAGALVVGDYSGGQTHFTQIAALGPEWSVHP